MLFNSLTFLLFLTLFCVAYWNIRSPKFRHYLLFAACILFYAFWRWDFVPLLMSSIIVDYWAGRYMEKTDNQSYRRGILIFSLIVNLGILIFFKYTYFILENFSISLNWKIILPLGVSFYTFHSMSYTIDVYRREIPAERNFLYFSNYVLFFPQLMAGPILRAGEIIPQLKKFKSFQVEYLLGIERIVQGLFLKFVLADNIAPFVDDAFSAPASYVSALDIWAMACLFGFQIYFDFAGYSHIAIGAAKLLGIQFPENFNFPYVSCTPREFWQRWHISLSSWIRDYLYLPLCGVKIGHSHSDGGIAQGEAQQASLFRKNIALFITWFTMGLWHGANWTFAVWGIWHATLIFIQRIWKKHFAIPQWAVLLFGFLLTQVGIMMGWLFFRAHNIHSILEYVHTILSPSQYLRIGLNITLHLFAFIMVLGVYGFGLLTQYASFIRKIDETKFYPLLRISGYGILVFWTFIFFRPVNQFIYFQF